MTDILTVILAIITVIYAISSNQDVMKKLSLKQKLGVSLTFIATIALATTSLYFGGSWLVRFLEEGLVKTLVSYAIIIIVLVASIGVMHKITHKITKDMM